MKYNISDLILDIFLNCYIFIIYILKNALKSVQKCIFPFKIINHPSSL